MDFQYGTEHDAFRESLRRFLLDQSSATRVREVAACGGNDSPLWQRLCRDLDVPGLHVATLYGGTGESLVVATIASEELGRALSPVPLLGTTMAVEAVLRMGDEEQRSRLLPDLLCGKRIGSLAAACPEAASAPTVRVETVGGQSVLAGESSPVLHGSVADLVIVPARSGAAVIPHVVSTDAPGVTVVSLPSFDSTRPVAKLTFAQAPAEALTAGTADDFERVLDVSRILLAAEMLGGAEACLALAVDYAKSRHQFDRPIGSFQAVKHTCADMMIEIDATRAMVMYAAMRADNVPELKTNGPMAKAQAADTFVQCAGSAIQIHGGIAFTWEHDLHLYFRRAHTAAALFGGSAQNRALVADRAGL
ncbi:acyl-CoA dehydrogenase family protein [Mycobacterium sp. ITM-2016-00318]|uniref:acyl-CoA dehydrogenase family protein n=1 Tax=Mycobacterium sp. ITM-2016-00318 TaxID=2099693 RepID=UPI000CF8F281|nr:acyl-CoA dehydrogenase family protein [Mycobacterium sp. ITM-2016-00318]WNG93915.1 acyl-CoA dehydrogenase family protein [Mycobacterium sp. ITM-2016-00318]